jgi:hypothetical protein
LYICFQENISNLPGGPQRAASLNEANRNIRESPNKRVLNKSSTKSRTNAGEEWSRQLEHHADFEEEEELQNGNSGLAKATRGRSSTKKKKKAPNQIGKCVTSAILHEFSVSELSDLNSPTLPTTALNGKVNSTHMYSTSPISARGTEKKGCCCVIM